MNANWLFEMNRTHYKYKYEQEAHYYFFCQKGSHSSWVETSVHWDRDATKKSSRREVFIFSCGHQISSMWDKEKAHHKCDWCIYYACSFICSNCLVMWVKLGYRLFIFWKIYPTKFSRKFCRLVQKNPLRGESRGKIYPAYITHTVWV